MIVATFDASTGWAVEPSTSTTGGSSLKASAARGADGLRLGTGCRYAGHFLDPDQHLWEVAWNPGWTVEE